MQTHNYDNKANFTGPLFIFGMARSGTTYLRRLMNSVPSINLMYETKIIKEAYKKYKNDNILESIESFYNFIDYLKNRELKVTGKSSILFNQDKSYYNNLFYNFRSHNNFAKFCEDWFSLTITDNGIWGNKLVDPEEFLLLLNIFKNAKFIIIIRDVRSVVVSNKDFFGSDYILSALRWKRIIQMLTILENGEFDNLLFIRYEDLVKDTTNVLKKISFFIDIDIPLEILNNNIPHTKSLNKWKKRLNKKELCKIEEMCMIEMLNHGYKPEIAKSYKKISFIEFSIHLLIHIVGRLRKQIGGRRGLYSINSLIRIVKLYKKLT